MQHPRSLCCTVCAAASTGMFYSDVQRHPPHSLWSVWCYPQPSATRSPPQAARGFLGQRPEGKPGEARCGSVFGVSNIQAWFSRSASLMSQSRIVTAVSSWSPERRGGHPLPPVGLPASLSGPLHGWTCCPTTGDCPETKGRRFARTSPALGGQSPGRSQVVRLSGAAFGYILTDRVLSVKIHLAVRCLCSFREAPRPSG